MVSDCIFCKIVAGDIPANKVYEDGEILAFLDINPLGRGHTLLIPKVHVAKLRDCPGDILTKLTACISPLAEAILQAVGAEAYNVLCNNGRAAGQLVEHLHFHIIPRLPNDGVLTHRRPLELDKSTMASITEKIQGML